MGLQLLLTLYIIVKINSPYLACLTQKLPQFVTDTEATIISAGHLFVSKSLPSIGKTKWLGCIDH
jgi:hypothetical protein